MADSLEYREGDLVECPKCKSHILAISNYDRDGNKSKPALVYHICLDQDYFRTKDAK